ncbi:ASPIC/UnbV domain-containing protein, partial [bacterium]|nr:ASPIC/UnbV domain-containing protein [bacterium]
AGSSYVPERRNYCNQKDHDNVLYCNNGDGTFTNITQNSGLEHNLAQSPHIVTADFDNDGYADIFMCNAYYKGKNSIPNSYYRNRNHGNNWITLKLRGHQSNYNAIGATVRLKTGNEQMMRQVSVGHGFGGASDSRVYFGLGKASRIDRIEINWPSGIHQIFRYSGALNQEIEIEEPIKIVFLIISRTTAKTLANISLILAAVLLAIFALYKMLPLFLSGWKTQKELQATSDELRLKPVSQIPILEIEIAILPYAGDYILIHQLRPSTPELFDSAVYQWGWQEKEPVILKKNKVIAIQQRLQAILDTHQNYIQNPEQLPLGIQKELQELGTKIHDYFGLTVFFRKLFSEPSLKNTFLQFIVDTNDIPWFLTYSEAEHKFLCDTFPISINFTHNRQSLFTTSEAEKQPFHKNIPAVILIGNAWQNHVKQLNEADAEIRELNRYFKTKLNHSCEICKSSEDFVTQVREFHKEKKNIRIIHYSGHIEHNSLAIGPDDYLSPASLERIYALKFETNPIVFLNGCGGMAVHYKNGNLAKYFLESGASACILTHAIVPEKTARIFAHYFYDYFIQEKTTVAEALQLARQKMATNRSINGQYDITRYLYQLYGNPLIKY